MATTSLPGSSVTQAPRLATLDAVRGYAVLGILILNIVDFGLPGYAYVDPNYYGGAHGADLAAWGISWVLFDGKMRGLFTMLFGASTVLVAERARVAGQSAALVHYSRMFWLLGFGLLHAYLVWYGDILALYAVAGAVVFALWRAPVRMLVAVAIVLLGFRLVTGFADYIAAEHFRAAALTPGAPAALVEQWRTFVGQFGATNAPAEDLLAYRGSYGDAFAARAATVHFFHTVVEPAIFPDTIALMALGMALYRSGFLGGQWQPSSYRRIAIVGFAVTLPCYVPLATWLVRSRFDPIVMLATEAVHVSLLRPLMALGHASLVILLVKGGALPWLLQRLAAAGRMAFSNYLMTSIACTTLFYGYGLGWFGTLSRAQLYLVVAGMWALILLWSKPWLDRFRYGPFEWLWRSLARGQPQPMRGLPAPTAGA